jgi:hypothetical protein
MIDEQVHVRFADARHLLDNPVGLPQVISPL